MDFGRALGVAFTTGSNRKLKEGEVDETEQIGWGHALIGIAILVVAQLGLILYSASGGVDAEVIRDLSIVAYGALIIPFILFWLAALAVRRMNRLPGAFLYLSITLAVLQVVTAVLASFGTGQSGFVIGIQAVAILHFGNMSRFALFADPQFIASMPSVDSLVWAPARAAFGDWPALIVTERASA